MDKLHLEDLEVEGKRVLVRVDFNVPLDASQQITDDTRIQAALPTIRYLLDHGAAVILMSHLGRPKGEAQPEFSLRPCAERLQKLLSRRVIMAPDCIGARVRELAATLQPGEVLMLENLRFHKAEEKPDTDLSFVKQLAQLGDCYVNDAFGTAHRSHASTARITEYFQGRSAAGYLLAKEIHFLDSALSKPERPFFAILGGAKVSSKLGVVRSLLEKVDGLVIGGAMAFTFLKAMGQRIGSSLCEEELIDEARAVIAHCKEREIELILPTDAVIAQSLAKGVVSKVVSMSDGIPDGWMGLDVGPSTEKRIQEALRPARTILWNGPLGAFETPPFDHSTLATARFLAQHDGQSIVGGGDSVAAINAMGLQDQFAHLSTGGGAALEYLEYGQLPGIDALSDRPAPTLVD